MTTTAASADSQRPFDPTKPAKHNVRLGESIAGPRSSRNCFTSVAFNHKPNQTGPKRKTTITASKRADASYNLSIDDEKEDGKEMQYKYAGRRKDLSSSYILTLDRDRQAFQLDPIEHGYEFNMVSAPWQKDETKLAQQYKQIELVESPDSPLNGIFSGSEEDGAGGESEGPSDSNPFDYRHYLNALPNAGPDSKQPSNVSTPVLEPRAGLLSPALHSRANGGTPRGSAAQTNQRAASSSRIRFQDRAASSQFDGANSDDDAGGLVIDGEPSPPPKKRRTAPPKGRPRSLHAAAEAARAAQAAKEASPPQQDVGSGYEEDDESDGQKGPNDDIDDLELPGPVSAPARPQMLRRQSTWDPRDEEELEAAIDAAFQADEDDEDANDPPSKPADGSQSHPRESESESEEE